LGKTLLVSWRGKAAMAPAAQDYRLWFSPHSIAVRTGPRSTSAPKAQPAIGLSASAQAAFVMQGGSTRSLPVPDNRFDTGFAGDWPPQQAAAEIYQF